MICDKIFRAGAAALSVCGCLPALSAASAPTGLVGRQSQNEGIAAYRTERRIAVDGDLRDWDLSGAVWSFSDIDLRDEYSVRTAAAWDGDALYLAFDWQDPLPLNSLVNPKFEPSLGWAADAVQLRIKAGRQVSWVTAWCHKGETSAVDWVYWKDPSRPRDIEPSVLRQAPNGSPLGDGIESVWKAKSAGGGFVHELRIPWRLIWRGDASASAGDSVKCGMEFMWGDSTGRKTVHRYVDNMAKGCMQRVFFWEAVSAWGDIRLVRKPVRNPCTYRAPPVRPRGRAKVRVKVPDAAREFSIAVEDASGRRVRNLAGAFAVADYLTDNGEVEVAWDGLDDFRRPVAPGEYFVSTVTTEGLTPRYSFSLYNPGTPPWPTRDGKGAWGADHTCPEFLDSNRKYTFIGSRSPEGGHGVWAVGSDGRKAWGVNLGVSAMAANCKYVYAIHNYQFITDDDRLLRLSAEDGDYRPFVESGKEKPLPVQLKDMLPDGARVASMAADDQRIALGLTNGDVLLLDAETATPEARLRLDADYVRMEGCYGVIREFTVPVFRMPLALADGKLAFCRGGRIVVRNLDSGVETQLGDCAGQVSALAFARDGSLLVADHGDDMQVKRVDASGRVLRMFGKRGGRPRQGAFDPDGVREMSAACESPQGEIFIAEYSDLPRRVSVWAPDGRRIRDYVGNTSYSGTGSFMHDSDPGKAYVGPVELSVDAAARTSRVTRILWNPPHDGRLTYRPSPVANAFGHIFRSSASGKERNYYFIPPYMNGRGSFVVLMETVDGLFRPVASIGTVGNLQGTIVRAGKVSGPCTGEFADCYAYDGIIWNDGNGDGCVQRSECLVKRAKVRRPFDAHGGGVPSLPLDAGWGQRMDPADLSFYASTRDGRFWRIKPVAFTDAGAPVFGDASFTEIPGVRAEEASPVPGEDLVVLFAKTDGGTAIAGMRKSSGEIVWRYPNPYPGVHASHGAPMPLPGMVIGPLKVAGYAQTRGDAGNTFLLRGNLGTDYVFTTDGMYLGSLFRDARLPARPLPKTEAEFRRISAMAFSPGEEQFNGWYGNGADGEPMTTLAMAREAVTVFRIEGLDKVRRLPKTRIALAAEDIMPPEEKVAEAKRAAIRRGGLEGAQTFRIGRDGQPESAECRLAWDGEMLMAEFKVDGDASPWMNGGREFQKLFKTGDAVDLCIADCRLLAAQFRGSPVLVLMRRQAVPESVASPFIYDSPVATVKFDEVRIIEAAKIGTERRADGYTVRYRVPWREIGVKPRSELKGDAGIILSDSEGTKNVARVYWSSRNTNLVSDLPGEAELSAGEWGTFMLEGAE